MARSQVLHFQPSVSVVGSFNWAAPQLNPPTVEPMVLVAAPGLGVSHTLHFTNREFNWGAAGLKPPPKQEDGWRCGTCDLMNPASVIEEAEVVVEGPGAWLVVEVGRVVVLVLGPALWEMNGTAEVKETFQQSSVGISSSPNPLTSFSTLSSPELLPSLVVLLGSVNVSEGSSEITFESASALASLGEVGSGRGHRGRGGSGLIPISLDTEPQFRGSLGSRRLVRPKNDIPLVVGGVVSAEGAPFKPAVCN